MSDESVVLVYRLGSLGDTIVSLPCFHAIERAFPASRRLVLTNVPVNSKAAPLEAILGNSGLIHGAVSYPVGTRSLFALWQLYRRIRALKADTLVYLTPARGLKAARRDQLFFRLCGVKRLIGVPLSTDLQQNRVNAANGLMEHEAERLARCLAPDIAVDTRQESGGWSLRLTDQEVAKGDQQVSPFRDAPFVAINMGGKVARNDWGVDHWSTLIPELSKRLPGWGLLVVGGPEDRDRAQAIVQLWGGPSVDACGRLLPRETAAAVRHAEVFIGHDSGPMHLAAAMAVRCVGLFGENNPPGKWHPYGKGNVAIHRMEGVRTIRPDEVLEAVLAVLGRSDTRRSVDLKARLV
jgi:ADP-heptose:LPS heptosyltransferase